MTSAQWTGLLATVGAAFLAQLVACALLFRRVQRLASRIDAGDPSPTSDPAQVAVRLRVLEARLSRIEAGATTSGPAASAPGVKRVRRLDRRQAASADGPVLIAVPSLAVSSSSPSITTEAAAELGRRFGGIWALADSGTTVDEIARETGFPVGQVELILGLRRPKLGGEGNGTDPVQDETDA